MAALRALKEHYPTIHLTQGQRRPAVFFGDAAISLGESSEQISNELSKVSRHLNLASDQATGTVIADTDGSINGQIKFKTGMAVSISRKISTSNAADLTEGLIAAAGPLRGSACSLRDIDHESGIASSGLVLMCGQFNVTVKATKDPDKKTSTTELAIENFSSFSESPPMRGAVLLGTVFDSKGAPKPGVVVLLENENSGFIKTSTTAADGSYTISGVPPGAGYRITACTADGTQIGEPREKIDVDPGAEREIQPPLRELPPTLAHFPK